MNSLFEKAEMYLYRRIPDSRPRGVTLIFSYIRWQGSFFSFKILNFSIFMVFRKINIFYEDFVDIFWGSLQNWTIFRGHFYAFLGRFL